MDHFSIIPLNAITVGIQMWMVTMNWLHIVRYLAEEVGPELRLKYLYLVNQKPKI